MAAKQSSRERVRKAYARLKKVGGTLEVDGAITADVEGVLSRGCLDETGIANLAENIEDLALIAEGLKVPGAYRPDDIPAGANPTLKIKCDPNHAFEWAWE